MDDKFRKFEGWYTNKTTRWEQVGIFVDEAGLDEKYGHQYWIKLHSKNGLGNIALYESNGYYWVDFESGNYDLDVMFIRSGIEFDNVDDLDVHESEFINYLKSKI